MIVMIVAFLHGGERRRRRRRYKECTKPNNQSFPFQANYGGVKGKLPEEALMQDPSTVPSTPKKTTPEASDDEDDDRNTPDRELNEEDNQAEDEEVSLRERL